MGCFDYECSCGASTCVYDGGQSGGESDVVIEVPLNDDTSVYIKGHYNSYGGVESKEYTFYPEQFQDYFKGWLNRESEEKRSKTFLCKRIWTVSYNHYDDEYEKMLVKKTECLPDDIKITTRLGKKTIEKFIRADKDLNILSDKEKKDIRIKDLKAQAEAIRKELEQLGEA